MLEDRVFHLEGHFGDGGGVVFDRRCFGRGYYEGFSWGRIGCLILRGILRKFLLGQID